MCKGQVPKENKTIFYFCYFLAFINVKVFFIRLEGT